MWYLDITRRGGADWLTVPIDQLLDQAVEDASPPRATTPDIERLASAPILRLTPFIEQMGNPSGRRKEFWWEREWRHVGDLSFGTDDIVVVLAPEDEHDDLHERLSRRPRFASRMPAIASNMPAFVDAQWGLERRIGALADVADLGPFPECLGTLRGGSPPQRFDDARRSSPEGERRATDASWTTLVHAKLLVRTSLPPADRR